MATREVSIVAFYDIEGRILLEDRRQNSRFGEEWGFFGGALEGNETKEEAAKREIEEELRYSPNDLRYIKSYQGNIGKTKTIEHLFEARFPGWENIKIKQGNGADLFRVNEIRQLKLMKTHYAIVEDLETRK